MKKLLFLFVACLALSTTSNAQEKGDISGFLGVSYLANTDGFVGINIGGEYMITDKLSVAPSYTYFLKKDQNTGFQGVTGDIQPYAINLDARYYLGGDNSLRYYGMAGVAFTGAKVTVSGVGQSESRTDTKTGLNIGGGIFYALSDSLDLVGQVKYSTPFSAVEPMVGISYNF